IVRNETDLLTGLEEIRKIRLDSKRVQAKGVRAFNQSWVDSMALWNMLIDCETIIMSALERKESRGAHTRSDYPRKDDAHWLVNIIMNLKDGQITRQPVPVEKIPLELAALINTDEVLAWQTSGGK
ncbi:MAG: hypothetical protein ACREBQ_11405, partial [Nitrososphaerales archaeon]